MKVVARDGGQLIGVQACTYRSSFAPRRISMTLELFKALKNWLASSTTAEAPSAPAKLSQHNADTSRLAASTWSQADGVNFMLVAMCFNFVCLILYFKKQGLFIHCCSCTKHRKRVNAFLNCVYLSHSTQKQGRSCPQLSVHAQKERTSGSRPSGLILRVSSSNRLRRKEKEN